MKNFMAVCVALFMLVAFASAQQIQNFTKTVGKVTVGSVSKVGGQYQVPYILWGGEAAEFLANGGLSTKVGTINNKLGLDIKLVPGDDIAEQVRGYMEGRYPIMRLTWTQIGIVSEIVAQDQRTQMVPIIQMTYSQGDHIVGGPKVKKVKDLKGGIRVAIFAAGPHDGLLDDALKAAGRTWKDITPIWCTDITGPNGPAAKLWDGKADAACVVTPDMIGLTGGLQSVGDGRETMKGARVILSTSEFRRSIVDGYVVRKDFYDANRDWVEKFVAGYFMGTEKLIALKKQYETSGSTEYMNLLKMVQDIYGTVAIPTLEEDAHGLIADAAFAGHPGNVVFFTEKNNQHGYEAKTKSALDLAYRLGYIKTKKMPIKHDLNYSAAIFTGNLTNTKVVTVEKRKAFKSEATAREIDMLNTGEGLSEKALFDFTIEFGANETDFSSVKYHAFFDKIIRNANEAPGAVCMARGHTSPAKVLAALVRSGLEKGIIKRTGTKGNYSYFYNGKQLGLDDTKGVIALIESGAFDKPGDPNWDPKTIMAAALSDGQLRAEAAIKAMEVYAKSKNLRFDSSQYHAAPVGMREPVIAKPTIDNDVHNRRVEVLFVRVSSEAASASDYDY